MPESGRAVQGGRDAVIVKHGCYEPEWEFLEDTPDQPGTWALTCQNCGEIVVVIDTPTNFCSCCVGAVHVHDDATCEHPCCPDQGEADA